MTCSRAASATTSACRSGARSSPSGVTYDTSAELLELIPTLIQQAVDAQDGIRFDRAHFKSFGPSSLDFETVYYVLQPDFNIAMNIQQAINLQLVRQFAEHGISFAFPTQTLHIQGGLPLAANGLIAGSRPPLPGV